MNIIIRENLKYIVGLVIVVIIIAFGWWLSQPIKTVILVRHAEKTGNSVSDPLSTEGHCRAEHLAQVTRNARITSIYATQYLRTQQTVQPIANLLTLDVIPLSSSNVDSLVDQILSAQSGNVVLVAGHSNTVPNVISELGGGGNYSIMDNEFDNLFIVTIYRFTFFRLSRAKVLHLHYGPPNFETGAVTCYLCSTLCPERCDPYCP